MIEKSPFGILPDGTQVSRYCISNKTGSLTITDFGCTLLSLCVPDAHGKLADVVLGFDQLEGYFDNPACFGASIGPLANRTDKAEVPFEGKVYYLPKNDGETLQNNLHTDLAAGLHKRIWSCREMNDHELEFSCTLHDGEYGLPGDRTITARVALLEVDDNSIKNPDLYVQTNPATQFDLDSQSDPSVQLGVSITYTVTTSTPTPVNLTNHSYFNLNGHEAGSVEDHLIQLNSHAYLPLRRDSISQGIVQETAAPEHAAFNFQTRKPLAEGLYSKHEQIKRARGYDHCFCLDGFVQNDPAPRHVARIISPTSGRNLDICVNTPGAHLYTGNWLDEKSAKDGVCYRSFSGFAFEPEFYPDFPHHPEWAQPICTPAQPYTLAIHYHFWSK